MISLTDLQHRLGFTRNEAAVIVFLSAGLIAGTLVRWLRPDPAVNAGIPGPGAYASADSEFAARSTAVESGATGPEADELPRTSGPSRPKAKPSPAPSSIDINTATGAALTALPGIGEAFARRIVAYREAHGRFGRIEDLMRVKGIGARKFGVLRPFVTAR